MLRLRYFLVLVVCGVMASISSSPVVAGDGLGEAGSSLPDPVKTAWPRVDKEGGTGSSLPGEASVQSQAAEPMTREQVNLELARLWRGDPANQFAHPAAYYTYTEFVDLLIPAMRGMSQDSNSCEVDLEKSCRNAAMDFLGDWAKVSSTIDSFGSQLTTSSYFPYTTRATELKACLERERVANSCQVTVSEDLSPVALTMMARQAVDSVNQSVVEEPDKEISNRSLGFMPAMLSLGAEVLYPRYRELLYAAAEEAARKQGNPYSSRGTDVRLSVAFTPTEEEKKAATAHMIEDVFKTFYYPQQPQ